MPHRSSLHDLRCLPGFVVAVWSNAALASQGPGIAPGTASAAVQTLMAILVYGTAAAAIMVALLRGMRRR
jgi:hypothetical protein